MHRAARLEAGLRPGRARHPGRRCCTTTWTTASACAAWSARPARRWASAPARTSPTTTASRASRSTRCSRTPAWCRSTVEGWAKPAWADPAALETSPRGRHRTTLLSPFDSLIWDGPRTERIFGFTHRLEAYVPKPKRMHGYFAMPLLAGGKLLGPGRPGPRGHDAGRPAGLPGQPEGRRADGPGPAGGGELGGLRRTYGWSACDAPELRDAAGRSRSTRGRCAPDRRSA